MKFSLVRLTIVLLLGIVTLFTVKYIRYNISALKAKGTEARMVTYATALHMEMSKDHSFSDGESGESTDILDLLQELYPSFGPSVDEWGTEFVLERVDDSAGRPRWELRSLGRDRTRGGCCRRSVRKLWDEDAVIAIDLHHGVRWLQAW